MAESAGMEVADWNSQVAAFSLAVQTFGRIDYVYAIAGISERQWLTNDVGTTKFQPPDLSVMDVNLTGLFYTVAIAVQQFRRQQPDSNGFRGKSKIWTIQISWSTSLTKYM